MSVARKLKRFATGMMLVALASASFAPVAYAAEGDVPQITQANGTLTVHKHEKTNENGTVAGTGLEDSSVKGRAIKGVKFKVQKVKNIDLRTNAGWAAAKQKIDAYKANPAIAAGELETGSEVATNDQGQAVFSQLPIGLYLVTETDTKAAMIGTEKVSPVAAKPFLVTIPTTNPKNRNEWLYNVHVYPKNSLVDITKSVNDENKQIGQDLTYTVKTGIPAPTAGNRLDKYVIIDPLPSTLTYKNDAKVSVVNGEVALSSPEIANNTDYNISYTAAKKLLKVTFTATGLQKLAQIKQTNPNAQVKLVFSATVGTQPATSNKVVHNTVYLVPSNEYSETPDPDFPDGGIPPLTPSDPPAPNVPPRNPDGSTPPRWPNNNVPPNSSVESKFGKIKFKKTASDKAANSNALAGAKFAVALCKENNSAPTAQERLTVNGKNEWTSAADGTFEIDGLHASNFKNGVADNTFNESNKQYCLWEVEAPQGYELLPEPIKFNITPGDNGEQTFGDNIVNYPKNGGFNLPLTGSTALIILAVAGALLVIGGSAVVIRNRKLASNS